MKKIYIDLFALNAAYAGGVSRFSLGLAGALLETSAGGEVKVIASRDNLQFLKDSLPAAQFVICSYRPFQRYVAAGLSTIAYLLRCPKILLLINYYVPAPQELISSDAVTICPTSTLNFYDRRITNILCIHDIQHEIHPENFSFLVFAARWARYRLSAEISKWVQVSSEAIKMDLLNKYGNGFKAKIFIAPEGFDENLFSANLPTRKPAQLVEKNISEFVYYPAQLWKHKNHKTVIEGLSIAGGNLTLVLTGKDYGELNNILTFAAEKKIPLMHLGIVPEIEMRWLYKNALCALAAGYHESSSLPVREAIASGGRILAADIAPNMEIKELAGLYLFETFSPRSFATQIVNLREKKDTPAFPSSLLIEDFSWKKIAAIYRQHL